MVDLDEDYIKKLYSDLLEKNLEVYKYPIGKGLRLSHPEDRKLTFPKQNDLTHQNLRGVGFKIFLPTRRISVLHLQHNSGLENDFKVFIISLLSSGLQKSQALNTLISFSRGSSCAGNRFMIMEFLTGKFDRDSSM